MPEKRRRDSCYNLDDDSRAYAEGSRASEFASSHQHLQLSAAAEHSQWSQHGSMSSFGSVSSQHLPTVARQHSHEALPATAADDPVTNPSSKGNPPNGGLPAVHRFRKAPTGSHRATKIGLKVKRVRTTLKGGGGGT